MSFSGMFRVALVRTNVSEEHIASIVTCSVFGLLVSPNVVLSSPILVTLRMKAILPSETSVLTITA
jgi:hypothetical protein